MEEEDIENVTLNKEFQHKSRVVSTSKSNTVTMASALSCSPPTGLPSSPASSALPFFPATSALPHSDVTSANLPSPSDPLAQHWSEIAPSLANLPEDQARPLEQMGNTEGLDLSLLDKEEWKNEKRGSRRKSAEDNVNREEESSELSDSSEEEDNIANDL